MPLEFLSADGTFTPEALAAPASSALAALLTERVDRVEEARARLAQRSDDEALHDFRVALRRLRSLLQVHRGTLGETLPRKLARGLRRIARATNASRDLEVKLDWLKEQKAALRPRDQVGLRWLARRLADARHEADLEAAEDLDDEFADLVRSLRRRIDQLARRASPGEPSMATVTAALLRGLETELEQHLAQVRSIDDQAEAHAARIVVKRVRYLLEPLFQLHPEAADLGLPCKAMQDVLGDMHDADVASGMLADAMEAAAAEGGARVAQAFRDQGSLDATTLRRARRRDPMPGLLALVQRVQARREERWTTFELEWLAHRGERLLRPLLALADQLAETPVSGLEIERKYLLRGLPARATQEEPVEIEQGYLPGDVIHERLRRARGRGGVRCYRTVKLGVGITRQEFEEPTTEPIFEVLWSLTEGRRLTKRRYRIADGGLIWEIDEFTDRDLILAEVELGDAAEQPALPDWLAPMLVREVTEDPAYVNLNLAR
jgi:CHAD domain-containing protein/CYTH domain-containing protein